MECSMKKFMYLTTGENNNLITVNPFVESNDYNNERKEGWLFSDDELRLYLEKYPKVQFTYWDEETKEEAHRLSELFGFEKL